MIEPTFIKDLNNTHLKIIWHNALLDLHLKLEEPSEWDDDDDFDDY